MPSILLPVYQYIVTNFVSSLGVLFSYALINNYFKCLLFNQRALLKETPHSFNVEDVCWQKPCDAM